MTWLLLTRSSFWLFFSSWIKMWCLFLQESLEHENFDLHSFTICVLDKQFKQTFCSFISFIYLFQSLTDFSETFCSPLIYFLFIYLGLLSGPFTNHRTAGEEEGISLTPHYHFHPLHRHLDISLSFTAESSPLYVGSSWNQTGNLWPTSASC